MRERNSYHTSYHVLVVKTCLPSLQYERLQGSQQEESILLMPAGKSSDQWAKMEKPKLSPGNSALVHTVHCSCLLYVFKSCGKHLRQSPRKSQRYLPLVVLLCTDHRSSHRTCCLSVPLHCLSPAAAFPPKLPLSSPVDASLAKLATYCVLT